MVEQMKFTMKMIECLLTLLLCLGMTNLATSQDLNLGANCAGTDASFFGCAGTIYDSGGASGDYTNNELWRYTICSEDGMPISTAVNFDLEANRDYLEFYDGQNLYRNQGNVPQNTTLSSIYPGQYAARVYTGTGSDVTYTSTSDCFTLVFKSNAVTGQAGFDLTYTSTGAACASNMANPNTGDAANVPGPDLGNGGSPSNDHCGQPLMYDGSIGSPGNVYTNINSTAGSGMGTNGCDPDPTLIPGQSTFEASVYFQYCTGTEPGEIFLGAGLNDCAGGSACVDFSYFKTADGAGNPGDACYNSQSLTRIILGTDLSVNDVLPANTCYIVLTDGTAGASCDFCTYFNVMVPTACMPNPGTIAPE